MRIKSLDLQAFGHFTDKSLDFSSEGGLNIIFGPNEAGKSTTMRALENFFFGFGLKSSDAFIHDYKDLAVRSVLQTDTGQDLDLTRYKRNKNSLLDAQGNAVASAVMNRVMAGMNKEMYANMFSLDHFTLRQGAREILAGGGHLGETLFAAASGITHLRPVLEELRSKCDALFRPRASSKPIWQNISRISSLNRQLRDFSVKPEQWRTLKNSLEQIQKQRQDLEQEISAHEAQLSRSRRYHKALRHISAYRDLQASLENLRFIPELSSAFAEKRVEILTQVNRLTKETSHMQKLRDKLEQDIRAISVCEKTISHAAETERLFLQSPVIIEARENISSLEVDIRSLKSFIKEKENLLPRGSLPADASTLKVSPGTTKKIEALAGELALLNNSMASNEADIRDRVREQESIASSLAEIPDTPESDSLEVIFREMSLAPELIKQEDGSKAKADRLRNKIDKGLSSLGLWNGSLDELACLALPLPQTIDEFEKEITLASQEILSVKQDLSGLRKNLAARHKSLSRLDPDQSIPDPDALVRHRGLRDRGWSLIKSSWLDNNADNSELEVFLQRTDTSNLCDGFEKYLHKADMTADSFLKNADHVAARDALLRDIKDLEDNIKDLESMLESRNNVHSQIVTKWEEIWSTLDITPLSPREMRAWLANAREILRMGDDLVNETLELKNIREKIHNLNRRAEEALKQQAGSSQQSSDLSTLCAAVDQAVAKVRKHVSHRENLLRDQKKSKLALDNLLARRKDLTKEHESKSKMWTELLKRSSLDPAKQHADILEEIRIRQEIHTSIKEVDQLTARQHTHKSKCLDFASQVNELLNSLGEKPDKLDSPENTISRLHTRLKNEMKMAGTRDNLKTRLEDTEDRISRASAELEVLEGEIAMICREGGTDDPLELPDIEEKASRKKELRSKLDHTLDNLRELSAGEDLNEFVAAASDFDSDELQGIIQGLEAQIKERKPRLEQLIKEGTEVEVKLRSMDGTSRALQVEQEIEEQRALLENHVHEYVRTKLAASIMAAEIERYRTANQGPVLKKAGDIFRRITLDSFKTIIADYDEKGEPVIRAVRNSGSRLSVDELSDGSRDQLFLALRLGGIYRYLDHNPPFPFMADDILVHFDDQRSKKTLSVLAQLSRSTQVLFFTHHHHLVDLALQIPQKNMVTIHDLADS